MLALVKEGWARDGEAIANTTISTLEPKLLYIKSKPGLVAFYSYRVLYGASCFCISGLSRRLRTVQTQR